MKIAIAHFAAVVVVLLSLMPSLEGAEKAKPSPNPLSPQAEAMTLGRPAVLLSRATLDGRNGTLSLTSSIAQALVLA